MEQYYMTAEERERLEALQAKERSWQTEVRTRRKADLAMYNIEPITDQIEMQAEIESLQYDSRHGMSPDEWSDYLRLQDMRIRRMKKQEDYDDWPLSKKGYCSYEFFALQKARKVELWTEYISVEDYDVGWLSILKILRFKIERCLEYWKEMNR